MTEIDAATHQHIAVAADTIFELDHGYIRQEVDHDQMRAAALKILRDAGRDMVHSVCSPHLEHLDTDLWASDDEVAVARKFVAQYVKQGWLPVTVFRDSGLGTHLYNLAEQSSEHLPGLSLESRTLLFSDASRNLQAELLSLHANAYVALNMLNPDRPQAQAA